MRGDKDQGDKESEKDREIANLKKLIDEIIEKNKEEVKKKESEMAIQLSERQEEIEHLQTTIDLQLAFSMERATNIPQETPHSVTPIQMVKEPLPKEPPSKILRIKAKERMGTKKPEFVYDAKPKTNKGKAGVVNTQPAKQAIKEVNQNVDVLRNEAVNIPKRLVFNKSCKVWHSLTRADQRQIRLINSKKSRYVETVSSYNFNETCELIS